MNLDSELLRIRNDLASVTERYAQAARSLSGDETQQDTMIAMAERIIALTGAVRLLSGMVSHEHSPERTSLMDDRPH